MTPRTFRAVVGGLIARGRSLWRGLRRRDRLEAEMAEEFRHHIEQRTDHLIRQGVAPSEAARRARVEFGHVEGHREEARASRGLRLIDELGVSWLDVKLGVRMLRKYPGLSAVSVIGMAVAIAIGAGGFSFISAMLDPTLPLPDSERIVSLQNSTSNPGNPDRQALHDFILWRQEVESVGHISAFRTEVRNLILGGATVALVPVAEMSASGFRVAGVGPVLGRPLLDDDERPASAPVVVIAHEEWQRRFDGRRDILGQRVRLGSVVHTVVGVMPEGFRFPVNHRYWVPLRLDPADYPVGGGPSIEMFGRLAPGATLEQAQAELATIGRRTAAEYPETHAELRPQVLPYAHPFFDIDTPGVALAFRGVQLAMSLLLILVALNVAVLVYARTATRTGEITVRTALGASRKRVTSQLFAEAFVLSAVAALIGLVVSGVALERIQAFLERVSNHNFPFWFDMGLTPAAAAYVTGLAVLAGVIVGVFPALRATGPQVQAGLQQLSSRGSGIPLGRTWTTLIVAQVGIAVAVLPFALLSSGQALKRATVKPAYAVEEILAGWLSMERVETPPADEAAAYDSAYHARYHQRASELLGRVRAEPMVAGATFARGGVHAAEYARFEVEGGAITSVLLSGVAPDFFEVLGLPVVAGRAFHERDAGEGAEAAIVDRVFAERVIGGTDVLGRRIRQIRYIAGRAGEAAHVEEGPWLEIVGVVPSHTTQADFDPADARVYLPVRLEGLPHVGLAIRVRGESPIAFAPRLREITASVDPLLQLHSVRPGADLERDTQRSLLFLGATILVVTLTVLLLSAAGIYAMMSFTVARRRREIGIRSALGASPRRMIGAVFARAGAQLGAGVAIGLLLALAVGRVTGAAPFGGRGVLLLPGVSAVILAVGLLAALGPVRRVLAVQPTDALREE